MLSKLKASAVHCPCIGFGIYRQPPAGAQTGLVQMFDQTSLWKEIGYDVSQGNLESNETVTLKRTDKSSPLFLENHSDIDDF